MQNRLSVLGLDPGLNKTGWGLVTLEGTHLKHLANGAITTKANEDLPARLVVIFEALKEIISTWRPDTCAVEETFVNKNPAATLKLNHARTIALLVPALAGLPVASYAPNHVKKSVVGVGHAGKEQVQMMVRVLLPGVEIAGADAADALAVAICHAHHCGSARAFARTGTGR
ncbi:MAG: crossover junction endodeoxyribonuclease RuvC [Proteobacteria bacterium]|nr:crossover junction endodeoxyribonuclease RuvC [Pseudomonadota bacterium]